MERDEILSLKVVELREKLRELQLSTTGRKATLQDRLLEHFHFEIEAEDETDNEEDFNSIVGRSDNEQGENNNELVNNRNKNNYSPKTESQFTLRDIQDSMSYFNGTDHQEIETWINEFNENANAVNWSELQKYVYAKQLLKGAAQKFIRSQNNITNWTSLKKALQNEFGIRLSAADRHRLLKSKKKRYNESFVEFLYSIIELGKPLHLDEESIIEYFTEGIPDARQNKTMLYEAVSIEDLKQKIKVYEKINYKRNDFQNNKNKFFKKKCSYCPHLSNHSTEECRKANNLCFICGGKGHNAKECQRKRDNSSNRTQQNSRENSQHGQYNKTNAQNFKQNKQYSQPLQNKNSNYEINASTCLILEPDLCSTS